jgi:hypothetical protein
MIVIIIHLLIVHHHHHIGHIIEAVNMNMNDREMIENHREIEMINMTGIHESNFFLKLFSMIISIDLFFPADEIIEMIVIVIIHHIVHQQKRMQLRVNYLKHRMTNQNQSLNLVHRHQSIDHIVMIPNVHHLVIVIIKNLQNDLDMIVVMNEVVVIIIIDDQAINQIIPIKNLLTLYRTRKTK